MCRQAVEQARHEVEYLTIHGHRRAFVRTGSGPALLLLHGLGADHTTWDRVIDQLARRYTVVAPDLLGHGESAKPRADYTLGGYANGMRDLLTVLGIDKVTLVGHSFGGGVAMQFAYQFPERTERLMLVGSGGLGPEVTPVIRAITTPGFEHFMGPLTLPGVRHVAAAAMRGAQAHRDQGVPRLRRGRGDLRDVPASTTPARPSRTSRGPSSTGAARSSPWPTARTSPRRCRCASSGARTTGSSRPPTPRWPPTLAPGARVEVIANAGHFPHKDHPERFVRIVNDFVRKSQPATYSRARFRSLLKEGRVPAGATEQPVEIATVTPIR